MHAFTYIVTLALASMVSAVATPRANTDTVAAKVELVAAGAKPFIGKSAAPVAQGPVHAVAPSNSTHGGVALSGPHTDITFFPSVPSFIWCTGQNCGGSCFSVPFSSLLVDTCYQASPPFLSAMAWSPTGAGFNFGVSAVLDIIWTLWLTFWIGLCRSVRMLLACSASGGQYVLQCVRGWHCHSPSRLVHLSVKGITNALRS
jgi:hypothetical protein